MIGRRSAPIPLAVSVVVRAYGWQLILGNGPTGLLNYVLMNLGIIDSPMTLLFSDAAVIIGSLHIFFPMMVLPLSGPLPPGATGAFVGVDAVVSSPAFNRGSVNMSPEEARRFVLFAEWWAMPVARDDTRTLFTRWELIRHVANKDGGAHVDPTVPEAHRRLSTGESIGWVWHASDGTETVFAERLGASIRQIAYEVLRSIHLHRGRLAV